MPISSPETARLEMIRRLELMAAGLPPVPWEIEDVLAVGRQAIGASHVLLTLPTPPWQISAETACPTADGLAAAVIERWAGREDALAVADTWADPDWHPQRRASDQADVRSLVLVPLVQPGPLPPALVTVAFATPRPDTQRLRVIGESIASWLQRMLAMLLPRTGDRTERLEPPPLALLPWQLPPAHLAI